MGTSNVFYFASRFMRVEVRRILTVVLSKRINRKRLTHGHTFSTHTLEKIVSLLQGQPGWQGHAIHDREPLLCPGRPPRPGSLLCHRLRVGSAWSLVLWTSLPTAPR